MSGRGVLPCLIAFAGRAGAGKSTAAAALADRAGFVRSRFAGPLKAMMRALGLTDDEIEGAAKEAPCALLGGRSPRHAMQTLGTEWGRDMIAPDLWVRAWRREVEPALQAGARIVVEDCRFANEAAAVRALGGLVVCVERPGWECPVKGQVAVHISEARPFECDATLINDGGPNFAERVVRLATVVGFG